MTGRLKQLQDKVLDFFFPRRCFGCGKIEDFICQECARCLERVLPPVCQRCGKPESSGSLCAACWGKADSIDAIRSVFVFNGTIRKAIHAFKYGNVTGVCDSFAEYMADYYIRYGMQADIIVPVPLHQHRLRQRGYNQSELIARELSARISRPFDNRLLRRIKDTRPQARTDNLSSRMKNVRDAFECTGNFIVNARIMLVDDVCTSGATLEACATALKHAGAGHVAGFTLAREI